MAFCPRCEDELAVVQATAPGESEPIEVDCCSQCGGVWIDGAELSRASAHLGAVFGKRRELGLSSRPSGLCCPRCEGALAEIGVNDVPVDWCRACHGVWLDGGEYQKIAGARRSAQPSTMICHVCTRPVPLGETYFSDSGVCCAGCRDADTDSVDGERHTSAEVADLRRRVGLPPPFE